MTPNQPKQHGSTIRSRLPKVTRLGTVLHRALARRPPARHRFPMSTKDGRLQTRRDRGQALKEAHWLLHQATEREQLLSALQVETGADKMRAGILILVVLAVVLTPVYGMFAGIKPEEFVQYITPITGITGTVLGYWFSQCMRDAFSGHKHPRHTSQRILSCRPTE